MRTEKMQGHSFDPEITDTFIEMLEKKTVKI